MTPKAVGPVTGGDRRWYSVRCVLEVRRGKGDRGWPRRYEERVTVWLADTPQEAGAKAKAEARAYATRLGRPKLRVLHVSGAFALAGPVTDGREIFSVVRMSSDKPGKFARRYADDFVPLPGRRGLAAIRSKSGALKSARLKKAKSRRLGEPEGDRPGDEDAAPQTGSTQLAARRALRARRVMSTWTTPGVGTAWVDHLLRGSGSC